MFLWREDIFAGGAGEAIRRRAVYHGHMRSWNPPVPLFGYSSAASFALLTSTSAYCSFKLDFRTRSSYVVLSRILPHVCTLFVLHRQVVEAIMCIFQEELESKVVTIGPTGVEMTVANDMQCRTCSASNNTHWVSPLRHSLLDHECIAESDTCR